MFLVSHTECKHSVFDIVTMISMLLLCPRGDRLLSVCTHCSSSPAFPSIIPSSFLLCGWCICTVLSRVLLKSAWQQHSSPSHGLMPFCSELNMVTNLPFKHFQCTVISLNCICLTAHFLFSAHYLWSQQVLKDFMLYTWFVSNCLQFSIQCNSAPLKQMILHHHNVS